MSMWSVYASCLAVVMQLVAISSTAADRRSATPTRRAVTIEDLVSLRDPYRLRISPDGKYATYVIRHAVLENNQYSSSLFLARTDASSPPERLVQAIEAVAASAPDEDSRVDSLWSQDSERVAFVRQNGATTELWVRHVVAGRDQKIAEALRNCSLIAWEGSHLIYATSREVASTPITPRLPDPAVLYDGRRVLGGSVWSKTPPSHKEIEYWRAEVHRGNSHRLTFQELQRWSSPHKGPDFGYPKVNSLWNWSVHRETPSRDGKLVAFVSRFVSPETHSRLPVYRGMALSIRLPDTQDAPKHLFESDALKRNEPLQWASDSKSILFMEAGRDWSRIHRVPTNGDSGQILYETPDGLSDLAWDADGKSFVAVAQRPTSPPTIVHVDLEARAQAVLHRPNANFDEIGLPSEPRYVRVVSAHGHEFGVRVTLPNGYKPGRRYPLVATTYVSGNEFQRGAVGDEYPIYAYAANGFVIASLDHFPDVLAPSQERNLELSEIRKGSPLDALEQVTRHLIDEGIVAEGRCGITGLSYGSEIVGYAMLHTKVFSVAAAATGDGVSDPFTYFLLEDSWREQGYLGMRGLPFPNTEGLKTWAKVSPALNAERIRLPLLLQPSDAEVPEVMQLYHSLRHAGVPVEMHVYPNEGHIKTSPLSKYWVYQRNLDWMRFWLKNEEDPVASKAEQYARWRKLRDEWEVELRERGDSR